jgi:hypothetical protein
MDGRKILTSVHIQRVSELRVLILTRNRACKMKRFFYLHFFYDNPTRKFLTNQIAAFFKFGPIKLIYSEKTPGTVKKQPAE